MHFEHLRKTPWYPTFEWVKTSLACATKINSYHEDYPKYVEATGIALDKSPDISNNHLLSIHRLIFSDKSFAGKFRGVDVRVGTHQPPRTFEVMNMMTQLESLYHILTIDDVIEWYKDFETIHPFQDGNGRVGSVIVAEYAHKLYPDKGWLAPNQ